MTCPNIHFNLSLASGKWVSSKTEITCVTSVQNTSDIEYAIKWPTYEIFFNICFCHSFISIFNRTFFSESNVTTSLQSKVHLNNTIYQVIEKQNQLNSLLTLKGHTKHFLNNISHTCIKRSSLGQRKSGLIRQVTC